MHARELLLKIGHARCEKSDALEGARMEAN